MTLPGNLFSIQTFYHLFLGFLQNEEGILLKPVQSPPRGERELNFYKQVFDPDCRDKVLLDMRQFMAQYMGTWSCTVNPGGLYCQYVCRVFTWTI